MQRTRIGNYSAHWNKIVCLDLRRDSHLQKDNVSGFGQIELNRTTLKMSGFSSAVKHKEYLIECFSVLNEHSTEHDVRYRFVIKGYVFCLSVIFVCFYPRSFLN